MSVARVTLAALLGPAAWFSDLCTRYFLVELGVARAHEPAVLALGIGFCLLALGAGVMSRQLRRRTRRHGGATELIATLGVALGIFSAIVIGAALIPHLYFDAVLTP